MLTEKQFNSLPKEIQKYAVIGMRDIDEISSKLAILTAVILCGIGTARELSEYIEIHTYTGKY